MAKRKNRKTSPNSFKTNHQSLHPQNQSTFQWKSWRCQICDSINPYENMFCVECYQQLYYYSYIGMHMFVENDQSFMRKFYHQPSVTRSKEDQETESTGVQDNTYIHIDWIEPLLIED